jgi:hypothetical protein
MATATCRAKHPEGEIEPPRARGQVGDDDHRQNSDDRTGDAAQDLR